MELTKEEKKRLEDFFKERDPDFDTVNTECNNPKVYFQNIDPSENKLDPDKVKKLLEWKDPIRLSTKEGKTNKKVEKVLENFKKINKFRKKELTEEEKKEFEDMRIFKNGEVYNTFIKHIARPLEYPIYDTHVLNAFLRLKLRYSKDLYNKYKEFFFALYEAVFGKDEPKTLEYPICDTNAFLMLKLGYSQDLYNEYKKFFFALYEAVFGKDEPKTVERMKQVDNALFNYDKDEKTRKQVDEALERPNPNPTKEDKNGGSTDN